MALSEASITRTVRTVTETAALCTVLWRNLVETPNGGGVFPDYPVTCKYASATFEVDDEGRKIHILEQNIDVDEITLTPEELYPMYMTPMTVQVNGQPVDTVLGEFLCDQVDAIIKARKLGEILVSSPSSQQAVAGDTVYLTVRIDKEEVSRVDYTISWYKDGVVMPGATTEEISDVAGTVDATYQAWITTPFGIAKSQIATITIVPAE